MSKKTVIIAIILGICLIVEGFVVFNLNNDKVVFKTTSVNLSDLTYKVDDDYVDLKVYTQDDFNAFLSDYENSNLPSVYVTEFIFDGVGMHKTYDLDDFIDEGNDISVDVLEISAVNINTTGNVELSGDLTGMLLVNTNGISEDINLILDGVNIDTDSKKAPAIYVYNKDITYADHKVTIVPKEGTNNYIEGGKLKKVSLIGSDELDSYTGKYSGEASSWFNAYSNYYGVYSKSEVDNILFAKVTADNEDLADGDPYYFYKASGAISSDIDLYFEGKGYLSVTSKNKEGIETKGNLTFSGSVGDYYIGALDDCLNTTTKSSVSNARNDLVIDVNSLTAIVSNDADEGDAIDSNGTLTINGGRIIAIAHPGQDAGLDSEAGTYINGGEILATGDMYDEIKSDSKQNFMVLSFSTNIEENTLITLLNGDDVPVFSYSTDRRYTNLVYSSSNLIDGIYSLYKDGIVSGENIYGYYNNIIEYSKGIQLGYTSEGIQGGMGQDRMNDFGGNQFNGFDGNIPSESNMEKPDDTNNFDNRENMPNNQDGVIPERPDNMTPPDVDNRDNSDNNQSFVGFESSNKDFTISGISNLFSGITIYSVE